MLATRGLTFHRAVAVGSTSSLVSRSHAGIRCTIGTAQQGKSPALVEDLNRMRGRALLLLGCAGGFRRSKLVVLDVADLENVAVQVDGLSTHHHLKRRRLGIQERCAAGEDLLLVASSAVASDASEAMTSRTAIEWSAAPRPKRATPASRAARPRRS
jgi:hypothetical protein